MTLLSIASDRKFGVEIEFVGISITRAEQALTEAGFNLENSGNYNHTDSTNGSWKVVSDATVSGGEVVSPILSGIAGLQAVQKAADAINEAGATANRSCGLHVHVDARDLKGRDVANVIVRYGKFEAKIDSVMPNSRRGAGQTYGARSVIGTGRALADFGLEGSIADVIRVVREDRYVKVNIQSYNTHGTIEFRQHSGTVQASKIIPWVQFCVNFVEKSRVNVIEPVAVASTVVQGVRIGRARNSKTLVALHKIVNALDDGGNRGVSPELLSEITGIKKSSVVVYISNLRTQYSFEIKKRNGAYHLRRTGDLPALNVVTVVDVGGIVVNGGVAPALIEPDGGIDDVIVGRFATADVAPAPVEFDTSDLSALGGAQIDCGCPGCVTYRRRAFNANRDAANTRLSAAVPSGAVAEIVENDTYLRGLPAAVVSYFSERASELAAA